jgi:hypothetical protein
MEKKAKATAKRTAKPAGSRTAAKRRRRPSHDDISTRAYFIHLDEGHRDELQNWLRAERELTAA